MKKISETIIFFGSGPVAGESLRLLAQDFVIEAVVTKPKLPHHRGSVPVLEIAEALKLPVLTAADTQALDKLFKGTSFKSRLAVLIDFGIIVSQSLINYFPLGIVNSHFSLLPEWRGADPITFAILSGQKQTGVSLMLLTAGLDEGPVLAYAPYDISPNMTAPELTAELIEVSYQSLCAVVPLYFRGEIEPKPQDPSIEPTYSRKLLKNDGILDFHKPAAQLEQEIRAFIEWPKSRTQFGDIDVVVAAATVANLEGAAGTTAVIDKMPVVYCGKQALILTRLKPAGKKEMNGQAFLAGYKAAFLQ